MKDKNYVEDSTSTSNSIKKNVYRIYNYENGMVNLYINGKQIFDRRDARKYSDTLVKVLEKHEEESEWIKARLDAYFENLNVAFTQVDVNVIMENILEKAIS